MTTFKITQQGWDMKVKVDLTREVNENILTLTGSKSIKYSGDQYPININVKAEHINDWYIGEKIVTFMGTTKTFPFTALNLDP